MLAERDGFMRDRTVGIVGVGNVGGRLQKRPEALGIKTLFCDPRVPGPAATKATPLPSTIWSSKLMSSPSIPLPYKEGQYKTLHLADEALISRLKPGTILINACRRGPVVDNAALLETTGSRSVPERGAGCLGAGAGSQHRASKRVDIGTAHIAGYTL